MQAEDHRYVRILGVRSLFIDEHWNTRNVRSTFWRLYCNEGSDAAVDLEGVRYEIDAHAVHLIPAWVTFSCRCAKAVRHFYAHFDLVGVPGPVVRRLFPSPLRLADPTVLRLTTEAAAAAEDPTDARAPSTVEDPFVLHLTKAAVHRSLAEAVRTLEPRQRAIVGGLAGDETCIRSAVQWIDEHLDEKISNEKLAGLCNWTTDHFIRRFKAAIGQTPARHIAERRIAAAAERLLFTDWSIERIAEVVGFPNRHYFSRVFADRMGLPPAAYRRTGHI